MRCMISYYNTFSKNRKYFRICSKEKKKRKEKEEKKKERKEKYKKSSLNAISGAIINWLKNTGYCKHKEGIYLYQEPNSLKQLKLKDLNSS